MSKLSRISQVLVFAGVAVGLASGQSFRVQCPTSTVTHPANLTNVDVEPPYNGPTVYSSTPAPSSATTTGGYEVPQSNVNGAIKCQQISGGDGYSTMGDGTQTYMFSFGPLSGLSNIAAGLPGTVSPSVFNTPYSGPPLQPGDPATSDGASDAPYSSGSLANFGYNGAIGQVPDIDNGGAIDGHVDPRQIMDIGVMNGNIPAPLMAIDEDDEFFLTLTNVGMIMRPDLF